jgi:hypothetical protein
MPSEMTTVTWELLQPNGEPFGVGPTFELYPFSYDAFALYPRRKIRGAVDENGQGSIQLWANETGDEASHYLVTLPSSETFFTTVPEGGPFTLAELRAAGVTESDPQYLSLITWLNAYDIPTGYIEGKPGAGELLLFFPVVAGRSFVLPAALAGSKLVSKLAATAECVLYLKKNGVQFGTITVAAAGTTGTFAAADETSFEEDDELEIYAPSSQDATFGNFAIVLRGVLEP